MSIAANMDYWGDRLVIPAVRYALGRRTHVVESVSSAAAGLLPHMQTKLIVSLERDLREAIDAGHAGDDCDIAEWRHLHERVIQTLADRQEAGE